MSAVADFVVINPDGTVLYDVRDQGSGLRGSLARHVPDLSTQGMGRVRAWFADDFSAPALEANPLAYRVLTGLGYRHPTGWYGPVALTMEETPSGNVPPLTPEVRETLNDLFAAASSTYGAPSDFSTRATTAEMIDAALPAGQDASTEIDSAATPTTPPVTYDSDSGVEL
ncbi:hypothetical protein [Nocardia vaccinii]|uniref:hypothetical protein n=1 Tax=Nocardia vaccinii TaxID=1822 RepID=UPI00083380FE|nr:hypothetical protein [Nocardia vaccinii]